MAGLALKHGVNANLLRKWIKLHQRRLSESTVSTTIESPFVPVIDAGREHAIIERKSALLTSPQTTSGPTADRVASLTVQMPNGVTLKLQFAGSDASLLSAMIETLGRCDVPAGR